MTRQCGECSLCCKLLPMSKAANDDAKSTIDKMVAAGWAKWSDFHGMLKDFDKPAGERCPHQRFGKGCTVYASRPFGCRMWNCRWLTGDDTAELRRPDRTHYVIDLVPDFVTQTFDDGSPEQKIEVVQVWVDPKHPDAWRDPALLAYLDRRGYEGKAALIRLNEHDAITVFPPSMTPDNQWHEITGRAEAERKLGETFAGVLEARGA